MHRDLNYFDCGNWDERAPAVCIDPVQQFGIRGKPEGLK